MFLDAMSNGTEITKAVTEDISILYRITGARDHPSAAETYPTLSLVKSRMARMYATVAERGADVTVIECPR